MEQGHVAVRVVALEACGSVWRVWGRANGSLEPPEKQMAGACSCTSCCLGGLRKGLDGLRPGKRQSWTPWKSRWQGHVAVRVAALEACGSVWRVWGRANGSLEPAEIQMAGACSCKSCCLGGLRKRLEGPLKNRGQGHVAVRVVALEACGSVWRVWGRANGSLEPPEKQMAGACSCTSCCLGGLRKGLDGLRPGKRQSWTPWKSRWQGHVAVRVAALEACGSVWRVWTAVCPPSNPPNASAGLQGNNSYSYMPLPSVFQRVQDCRLPALKPSKRFRRPPRQQLLQLHAPALCFSAGSRLPFARPQTLQTLPQASMATTLTATCPCPLFFSGFKTVVCPASNPPNPSAGLQGNNSYSYMPLPSVFQGVQRAGKRQSWTRWKTEGRGM